MRTPEANMDQDQTSTPSFWDKVGAEYAWGRDSVRYDQGSPQERASWDKKCETNPFLGDHSTAAGLIGGPVGMAVGGVEAIGDGVSSLYHHLVD
jgi:hypothetical protein